ncbi:MAG TPA: hypothetical protein V6D11_05445 [Waterburya sp.]
MNHQYQIGTKQFLVAAGTGLLVLPLLLYGWLHFIRPSRAGESTVE